MFELRKHSKEIALVSSLTLGSLGVSACALFESGEDTAPAATNSTVPAAVTTAPETTVAPQVEYYPLETGRDDRSEIFKVITLDDGRTITCLESHLAQPGGGGAVGGVHIESNRVTYEVTQDCDIENLAQQTASTIAQP